MHFEHCDPTKTFRTSTAENQNVESINYWVEKYSRFGPANGLQKRYKTAYTINGITDFHGIRDKMKIRAEWRRKVLLGLEVTFRKKIESCKK